MTNFKIEANRLAMVGDGVIGFEPTAEELEFFKKIEGKKIIVVDGDEIIFSVD